MSSSLDQVTTSTATSGVFNCLLNEVNKITALHDGGHYLNHWFERWCVHRRDDIHQNFKILTNIKLTLDQPTAVAGGSTAIECGLIAAVHFIPTTNLQIRVNQLKGSNLRINDNQWRHTFKTLAKINPPPLRRYLLNHCYDSCNGINPMSEEQLKTLLEKSKDINIQEMFKATADTDSSN